MRRILLAVGLWLSFFLFACGTDTTTTTTITVPACDKEFTETMQDEIPIVSVTSPTSEITGNSAVFTNVCKLTEQGPLLLSESNLKTHQVVFELDAIYPLDQLQWTRYIGSQGLPIENISVDVSLNGQKYTRVLTDVLVSEAVSHLPLENRAAKFVRIVFSAVEGQTYGLQDIRFQLGQGFIVREATEWSEAFLRYDDWTGADGIFSFNLNGDDSIGAPDPTSAFIFSDTFVGSVNPFNKLRLSNVMINNSVGYYDGGIDLAGGLSFAYDQSTGAPKSAFSPDAYLGYQPGNLLDSDGLSIYLDDNARLTNVDNGIMWRAPKAEINQLYIDLQSPRSIGRLTLWNYNANPDLGIQAMVLETSMDQTTWTNQGTLELPKASGNASEPFSLQTDFEGIQARYLRFTITQTYDDLRMGLGKILIHDADGKPLYGQITASTQDSTVEGNESSGRLWLQDGIVSGNHLYIFPILVKDTPEAFEVTRVGMIKTPIVEGTIDFAHAEYLGSPLQSRSSDGGNLYFGAGVMDNASVDGYVYVYGYKDHGGRHLTVARVPKAQLEDFNAWTYYDGSGWSSHINDSAPLLEGVSPELSVTHIESGLFAGKYMVVAMEGTTSGKVSYAIGDSPQGPFSDFTVLYLTPEAQTLNSAFTYNAKMHVHLSQPGSYLISYNVNALQVSALVDARIYHPRFILITEVKQPS